MRQARFGRLSDAPANLLIAGARVIDPSTGTDGVRDVAVRNGVIVHDAPSDAERVDGRGLVVAPGFCDLHVHLREPGDPDAETIESGTRAAARGGFTTVCAMPNTDPPLDDPGTLEEMTRRDGSCRVRVIAAATRGRRGEAAADLPALATAGAVGFSDDGAAIADAGLARAILGELARLDLPLVEHAEEPVLAAGTVMRAGPTATRLGLKGWPAEAEVSIVERDIALADERDARLHLTHLSTAASLDMVRSARARGSRVTCDVTPHHLALTDAWVAGSRELAWDEPRPREALAYDGSCRVNPPLPSREDALALLAALADGTVDAIATDHAPHPPQRKLVPFEEAAPGLIGLEMALSLGLAAVAAERLELGRLVAALSTGPAAIVGESRGLSPGAPADLVAFDPNERWMVEASALASASTNTPLLGMELPGVVRLTVAGGRVTYRC